MGRKEIFVSLAFFIGVVAFFFYKTVLFGLVPFPGDLLISEYNPWKTYSYEGFNPGSFPNKAQYFDTIRQIYPWRLFSVGLFKQGEIPLWNPHNFSGAPLLANVQSAIFYPFNILYFIFSSPISWTFLIVLQPLLSSLFTYLFARSIGISKIGSFLSAIAFSYSLFMAVFLEYNTIGHVISFLPLSLCLGELLLKKTTIVRSVLFSASITLPFLAGHLQIAGFTLLFAIAYFVFRTKNIRLLVSLMLLMVFGVGMSAVQLLPTFELIQLSARVPQDYQFLIEKLLLQPQQLILFFSPDFFGNPATRNYLIPDTYPGNAVYIGLAPLLFAFFTLAQFKKNKYVQFFALFFIVLLFLLIRSPATELFYKFEIPLFSTGSPTNAIFLLSFALSILSGFGLDVWLKDKKDYRALVSMAGLFVVIWALILLVKPETVSWRNFFYSTAILGASAILFGIGEWLVKKKPLVACLFLFITILDLFYFFHKFNPFVPSSIVFPNAAIFSWLSENTGINRFWGYGTAAIEANFTTQYKLFSPDGYDPLYPKRYGEFIQSSKDGKITTDFTNQTRSDAVIAPGFGGLDLSVNPYRLKVLDLLGVKYILDRVENGSTQKTFPADRFRLVYEKDGWDIFENQKAVPRVFLTTEYQTFKTKEEFESFFFSPSFDVSETVLLEERLDSNLDTSSPPAGEARQISEVKVVSYSSNQVSLMTNTDSNQLLFLSDTYYPGWKAFIDGDETKIYRADYAFRSVIVPKGEHMIQFRYEPESFSMGAKTTIISSALMLFFSFHLGRKKHA